MPKLNRIPPEKSLKILLWLVAIHSLFTGIFLIVGPVALFHFFGFHYHGGFFTVQGGVFHLVMVVAYMMTASNLKKDGLLIWFCISAKVMAAVFLLLYFAIMEQTWVIFISGVVDLIMGLLLLQFYNRYKNQPHA